MSDVRHEIAIHPHVALLLRKLTLSLEWAIKEIDRNTCNHDETHRGGNIWTICNSCGKRWADDRGGFVPYREPKQLTLARRTLSEAQRFGSEEA